MRAPANSSKSSRAAAWLAVGGAVVLAVLGAAPAAAITPTVTEYVGGVTPGFTVDSQPESIAAGPDGNLWFTQVQPGRVVRITPAGVVTEFTNGITPNFELDAIAAGPDGNLWFTQETNPGRLGRITPAGNATEFVPGPATPGFTPDREPSGITAGPDGNVWFTEETGPAIARITPMGVVTEFTTGISPSSTPDGITAGPDGNLWFTEQATPGRIGRITPSGVVTEFTGGVTPGFSAGGEPTGITAGPDGNLWFTEQGIPARIGRITPAGVVTEFTAGITPESAPEQIAAGPDGNLWFVASENPGRVGRITPAGVVTEFAGGVTPGFSADSTPKWIVAGADGNMWFTGGMNPGRVSRITTPPAAETGGVSGITTTSATVAGTANGHAQATTANFEVGPLGGATTVTPAQGIGSGSADTPVTAELTGMAQSTTYQYRLVATNPTDTTAGAFRTFTTAAVPRAGPIALAAVSRLRVSPRIFSAADRGGSIAGRRKRRRAVGTRVSYTDSQPATTTFTVLKPRPGVRRGRRCVAPPRRRGNTRRRRCTRFVSVGGFRHADRAGANSFRFTGRVRRRKLAPGRYRLRAVPRFAGRNGKATSTSFRIVG